MLPRTLLNAVLDTYAFPYVNAGLGRVLPFFINRRRTARPARRHPLPGRLVVSITSYPPRFPTLPLTLKCLMSQSVAPDEVVLWIAREDRDALTREILLLQDEGVRIRFCDDLRSYKKIVPTLMAYPDAYVLTADDDVYYGRAWVEKLVAQERGRREVLCYRAHRIRVGPDGLPLPYRKWEIDTRYSEACSSIFPTGIGGVLYPPGALHRDVADAALFRTLCPHADDVWLYWMMQRNGTLARKIGSRRLFPTWRHTQRSALWQCNVMQGGNDKCIRALAERFGFPHGSQAAAHQALLESDGS